jgi:hypothetical protein
MNINTAKDAKVWFDSWKNQDPIRIKNMLHIALESQYLILCNTDKKRIPDSYQDCREIIGYLKSEYFKLTGKGYICSWCKIDCA